MIKRDFDILGVILMGFDEIQAKNVQKGPEKRVFS